MSARPADAPSGPHGLLVFTALLDGQWDVYALDLGRGSVPRRISNTPIDEQRPRLTRDRSSVLYTDSEGHCWIQRLTGAAARRLTSEASCSVVLDVGAGGAPDAMVCAVRSARGVDDPDLFLLEGLELAGRDSVEVLGTADQWFAGRSPRNALRLKIPGGQFQPAISHGDARRLCFVDVLYSGPRGVVSEIFEGNLRDRTVRQLTLTGDLCEQPNWSPDDSVLVFCRRTNGRARLCTVDLRTREVRALTHGRDVDEDPCFSPDGRSVAFVTDRSGIPEIWIYDLRDGRVSPLRPFGREGVICRDPDWR